VWKTLLEGLAAKQEMKPEGRGVPISQGNLGDGTKGSKPSHNILPDESVEVVVVSQVAGVMPTIHTPEPGGLGGRGIRVEFSDEFFHEGRVLGRERDNPKPPTPRRFWGRGRCPRPPYIVRHCRILSLVQRKAQRCLSIASMTPAWKSPALIACESI
jgi:hypothetical protein